MNDTDHEHRVHAGLEPTTFDQMDKHGADVPNQFSSYSQTFIFVKQHDIKLKWTKSHQYVIYLNCFSYFVEQVEAPYLIENYKVYYVRIN